MIRALQSDDLPHFIKLLELIALHDATNGLAASFGGLAGHHARFALSQAGKRELRAYVRRLDEWTYAVAAITNRLEAVICAAWVHEDGILKERSFLPVSHPVHTTHCITDFYERAREAPTLPHPVQVRLNRMARNWERGQA